ncbi:MAG TPA: GtrA family protein [Ktedonobacter sp.]|nr:GtrA family protein [Ktedonobacter sp.]
MRAEKFAWRTTFWQFLRYCLVGGANTLSDVLVLNILLWCFPTHSILILVIYNSTAYSSGAVTSFFLNKYWTFGHKQKTTIREVRRFFITLGIEILYSNGFLWLAGKLLQPFITNVTLWGNASKLVAILAGTLLSYLFMRFWTFANGPQSQRRTSKASHKEVEEKEVLPETREVGHAYHALEKGSSCNNDKV